MQRFQGLFLSIRRYWKKVFSRKGSSLEDYMLEEVPEQKRRSCFLMKTILLLFSFSIILFFVYEQSRVIGAVIMSFVLIGPIFGWLFYNSYRTAKTTHIEVLTPEGVRKKQEEESARLEDIQVNEDELGFNSAWYIRYPLAMGCLVLTSILANYAGDAEDAKFAFAIWLWVAILGVFSLIYAREVSLFALGALLLYWLFIGIAALPVSVAIVMGAVIVASALKR